ncbi:MAG: amidohydrolase [Pigmentiphaga sp.]|nr:amidohydrolase [Pigmentiphaga sp.]
MSSADAIVLGNVITLDAHGTRGEALAVREGKVLAVGFRAAIEALRGADTRVFDYSGRTIIPGFNDTHAHLDSLGLQSVRPSLAKAKSIDDVLDIVRRLAADTEPGRWIVTTPVGEPPFFFGGPRQLREGRMPDRHELDRAAPDHPVHIPAPSGFWGQPPCFSALNSRALALNGIDRQTAPRASGVEIEKDDRGEPTGVIIDRNYTEAALLDILPAVPRFSTDERLDAIRRGLAAYHAKGTTSIYEGHGAAPAVVSLYRDLHQAGELRMRVTLVANPVLHSIHEADRLYRDWLAHARGSGMGDAWLRISGIQVPYGGDPVVGELARKDPSDLSWSGYVKQAVGPTEFEHLALLAARHDLRLHTIASDLIEKLLPALERVAEQTPISGKRWVIEHVGRSSPEVIARLKKLGVGITLIPAFHAWKVSGGRYLELPDEQQAYVAPARQLLEAGIPVAAGTDGIPHDPLFTVWAMVNRQVRDGGQTLGKAGCTTVDQALRLMTTAGAWFSFEEKVKGPLQPGYFADLAVLSEDPTAVAPERLRELECLATMVDGGWVYGEHAAEPCHGNNP